MRNKYFYTVKDLLGKVTAENYFIYTAATWTTLACWEEAEALWAKMRGLTRVPNYAHHRSPINGSRSEYIIDHAAGIVYRFSDHWGKVSTCHWKLDNGNPYATAVAKCRLKDFRFHGQVFVYHRERFLDAVHNNDIFSYINYINH